MYKLTFYPFVGSQYEKSDFKILILGESHHNKGNSDCTGSEMTKNYINEFIDYKKGKKPFYHSMNTLSRFVNIFNGKKLNNSEAVNYLESIAFYNYVQVLIETNRKSPSLENFSNSIDAFKLVLNQLNPDLIIFWGNRLWNNFPKANHKQIKFNDVNIHYLDFEKKVPFKVIPHPASSQLTYFYTNEMNDYIKLVKSINL